MRHSPSRSERASCSSSGSGCTLSYLVSIRVAGMVSPELLRENFQEDLSLLKNSLVSVSNPQSDIKMLSLGCSNLHSSPLIGPTPTFPSSTVR
jgi:hypothetical protein